MEETYSERINLVFGKGIDVVATHAKHGDLDTKREIYIKIKRKKRKKNRWTRDGGKWEWLQKNDGRYLDSLWLWYRLFACLLKGGEEKWRGTERNKLVRYQRNVIEKYQRREEIYSCMHRSFRDLSCITTNVPSCTFLLLFLFPFYCLSTYF